MWTILAAQIGKSATRLNDEDYFLKNKKHVAKELKELKGPTHLKKKGKD